jgi:hypothetical protein
MGADAARLRRLGPCWLSSIPARPVYAGGLRAFTRGTARAPMMRSMGDNSLIPISDEQAKLGQELVKAVRDSAGYFTGILGDLPKDLIGLLIGDKVKAKRIERWAAIWQRTRERLQDRGADPEPPSLEICNPDSGGGGGRGERGATGPLVTSLWPPRWTRTDGTRCASPLLRRSSKSTR